MKRTLTEASLPSQGPYSLERDIRVLADHLGTQIHVYTNRGMGRLFSHPLDLDLSLPQVYLFESTYDENFIDAVDPPTSSAASDGVEADEDPLFSHVELITNVESFFKNFPLECLRCFKYVKSLRTHICYSKNVYPSCFACQKIIVQDVGQIFFTTANKRRCIRDKVATKVFSKKCEQCGVICESDDCRINHVKGKNCVTRGSKCDSCNKFVMNKGNGNDIHSHKSQLFERRHFQKK